MLLTEDWKQLLPDDFTGDSRVWVFQASRPFIAKEVTEINEQLYQFYVQWEAHGAPVKGWAQLLFRQFIVVIADETQTKVSGCSTDGMTRIIKSLERQYEVSFFDRTTITFLVEGKAEMLPMAQIPYALEQKRIHPETLLFNNIVGSLEDLKQHWLLPLKNSWLAAKLKLPENETGKNIY